MSEFDTTPGPGLNMNNFKPLDETKECNCENCECEGKDVENSDSGVAIGIKLINFKRMKKIEFEALTGRKVESIEEDGYMVIYVDGYKSWSPKTVFESSYFKLSNSDNKISKEDVINFIGDAESIKIGDKTALVTASTVTGFDITESSSCVDPENYDHSIGVNIAFEKIIDKIWSHLGFVLQWAKNSINKKTIRVEISENTIIKFDEVMKNNIYYQSEDCIDKKYAHHVTIIDSNSNKIHVTVKE